MTAVGVIPARYAASRFPGKPLAPIAGVPMVRRVWEGARRARRLRAVIVATDDERIADACRTFGAPVVMTRSSHATGTDRLAEVAATLEDEIIVNVQGDEPLIEGFVVDAALEALREDPEAPMSTVVHPADRDALRDCNRVKVALDGFGNALCFSRNPIPPLRPGEAPASCWQHVGLYAYRRSFLLHLAALEPSARELEEGLEQLRALENGHRIRCAAVREWRSIPVDVPADVARVEARIRELSRAGGGYGR